MDLSNPEEKGYLMELYNVTQGDTGIQASMYEVGANLGLEKGDAGAMAENLIVQGWVDLVSLSGAISLTQEGLEALQMTGSVQGVKGQALRLGAGPVLLKDGCEAVNTLLDDIKGILGKREIPYPKLEEIVIDIKTIETQMLSPQPKVEVVRELFRSLQASFVSMKIDEPLTTLNGLISS